MDRIFIDDLHLDCLIGITDEERRRPQIVVVDVSLYLKLGRPGASGRIGDTVDYREARRMISEFVMDGKFTLLEGLAEGIASLALRQLDVERVVVRVRKEKYSIEPSIGIEIERARGA